MRVKKYNHIFVDTVPATLQEKVIYVSVKHKTVAHLCACGCGHRIDTPLDPEEWKLTYDGEHISLWPSIGNWDLSCRSHYFITGDKAIPVRSRHKKQQLF